LEVTNSSYSILSEMPNGRLTATCESTNLSGLFLTVFGNLSFCDGARTHEGVLKLCFRCERAFLPKQTKTPHAKAQNEVPAADANDTPALERVQAV
jgi:hypothetical protein